MWLLDPFGVEVLIHFFLSVESFYENRQGYEFKREINYSCASATELDALRILLAIRFGIVLSRSHITHRLNLIVSTQEETFDEFRLRH